MAVIDYPGGEARLGPDLHWTASTPRIARILEALFPATDPSPADGPVGLAATAAAARWLGGTVRTDAVAFDWDADAHPRAGKGGETGGQFVSKDDAATGSAGGADADQSAAGDSGIGTPDSRSRDADPPAVREARDRYAHDGPAAPAFKAWFGDWQADPKNASKVVKADNSPQETFGVKAVKAVKGGKPVVVYHGTVHRFDRFDTAKDSGENLYGPGFYFTEDRDVAGGEFQPTTKIHHHPTREAAEAQPGRRGFVWQEEFGPQAGQWAAATDVPKLTKPGYAHKGLAVPNRAYRDRLADAFEAELARRQEGHSKYLTDHEEGRVRQAVERFRRGTLTADGPAGGQPYTLESFRRDVEGQPYNFRPLDLAADAGVSLPGHVLPCYLNLRNPFRVDAAYTFHEVLAMQRRAARALGKAAARVGDLTIGYDEAPTGERSADPKRPYSGAGVFETLRRQHGGKAGAVAFLKAAGFDGLTHVGGGRWGGGEKAHRVWIAWTPTQVKAVDNRGTFDPTDDRVGFAGWTGTAHPRAPKGVKGGGRFVKKDAATPSAGATDAVVPATSDALAAESAAAPVPGVGGGTTETSSSEGRPATPEVAAREYREKSVAAPAFKAWFGDWQANPAAASKVVKANGSPAEQFNTKPLTVYHGTAAGGFDRFDPDVDGGYNIFGKGFYFTEDKGIAQEYTAKGADSGARMVGALSGFTNTKLERVTTLPRAAVEGFLAEVDARRFSNPNWDHHLAEALRLARTPDGGADTEKFLAAYRGRLPLDYWGKRKPGETDHRDANVKAMGLEIFVKETNKILEAARQPQLMPIIPSPKLYEVYLNVRKPFDMDEPISQAEIDDYIQFAVAKEKARDPSSRHGWGLGIDDLIERDRYKRLFPYGFPVAPKVEDFLNLKTALLPDRKYEQDPAKPGSYRLTDRPAHGIFHLSPGKLTKGDFHYIVTDGHHWHQEKHDLTEWIKARGHDGIAHTGGFNIGTKDHRVWIAFEPTQIKAVDNAGTFDPADDRIGFDFNPDQVRHPKGTPDGGRFAPAGDSVGDSASDSAPPPSTTKAEPSDAALPKGVSRRQATAARRDYAEKGTRAKAFKSWFGEWESRPEGSSKVVSKTGEPQETFPVAGDWSIRSGRPLVVYHGTRNGQFDRFSPNKADPEALFGPGYYFTEDATIAGEYRDKSEHGPGGQLKDGVAWEAARDELLRRAAAHPGWADQQPRKDVTDGWMRTIESHPGGLGWQLAEGAKSLRFEGDWMHNGRKSFDLKPWQAAGIDVSDLFHVPHPDVKACYLNIRNPLDLDAYHKDDLRAGVAATLRSISAAELSPHFERSVSQSEGTDPPPESVLLAAAEQVKQQALHALTPLMGPTASGLYMSATQGEKLFGLLARPLGKPGAAFVLARHGFDGYTHVGGTRAGDGKRLHRVWVALQPNQVKAVDNAGTFRPDDDRIAFGWDSDNHPRAPKGSDDGGQFVSRTGGTGGTDTASAGTPRERAEGLPGERAEGLPRGPVLLTPAEGRSSPVSPSRGGEALVRRLTADLPSRNAVLALAGRYSDPRYARLADRQVSLREEAATLSARPADQKAALDLRKRAEGLEADLAAARALHRAELLKVIAAPRRHDFVVDVRKGTPPTRRALSTALAFVGPALARVVGPAALARVTLDRGEGRPSTDPGLGGSTVNLVDDSVPSAIHELGHVLEHHLPGAREAAHEFLSHRGLDGDRGEDLSLKFPAYGFRLGEIGRKDAFDQFWGDTLRAYYTGKRYDDGQTEALAMGLEALYRDPARFCATDPEFATFVLGVLNGRARAPAGASA